MKVYLILICFGSVSDVSNVLDCAIELSSLNNAESWILCISIAMLLKMHSTVSTQPYECVKLSKHTQTIKVEKKVGASQTMNNSEGSVSSIATKKTGLGSKSANISTSQVKINKTQTRMILAFGTVLLII
jgi:hypothetical protein